ncbi:PAS domain S-box protein [Candidatus Poribacteria bacterium]|nr:PAS domain S-box protein [Candidatus Poribacteria bacterium]
MTDQKKDPAHDPKFEALLEFIKRERGFDFTGYKRTSLMRRVNKRMQTVNKQDYGDYMDYLEVHPDEFAHLFNTILINVTSFFRDAPAWEYIAHEVVPQIIEGKPEGEPIRVWSVGCASGEEAYSLAIVFAEALGAEQFKKRVKIYATDIDENALNEARHALYSDAQMEGFPAEFKDKYFTRAQDRHAFSPEFRRSAIFGAHDVMKDSPISRIDLLVCRNTLMYFNSETQNKILSRLHFALNDDGFLFLGKAEMILTHTNLFVPTNLKYRIFKKTPGAIRLQGRAPVVVEAGCAAARELQAPYPQLQEAVFERAPSAQMVVDQNENLTMANAEALSLFGLDIRDVGRPFHELEVSYRPLELRSRIKQAYSEMRSVYITNVERTFPEREPQYLDIYLVPLFDSSGISLGVSMTFTDVTRYNQLERECEQSTNELESAYEELQSSSEELETTNEELQSTVEELETTNEELQSSSEEMETMNEELQATNEELNTINDELRERTDMLNQMNAFLESIIGGVRMGVVVVDRNLKVTNWNKKAEDLWGLRADEVKDQFLLNLDIGLPVEQLKGLIRAVLAGETDIHEATVDAISRRGKAIQCHVTSSPLIGATKEIEGVIILMEEGETH